MVLFIIGLILLGIAVAAFIVSRRLKDTVVKDQYRGDRVVSAKMPKMITRLVAAVAAVLGLLSLFGATFYTQDPGEARVLRSFTGEVVGQDIDAGAAFKAPWVDLVDFDIRNQVVSFIGDGTNSYNGQVPNGPQITTQDRDGATVNIDIVVQYSIEPDAVTGLYENYQNQENFVTQVIENDVRSLTREVPNRYSTVEVRTERAAIAVAIQDRLIEGWAEKGIIVESVALQETRYSAEVTASFDQAQQARINVEREQANLEAAQVQAQVRVAEATAQAEADIIAANANAEANRLLTASLTPEVLQQRYLDTLSEVGAGGNLVVVPEGFNGLVNVSGQQ